MALAPSDLWIGERDDDWAKATAFLVSDSQIVLFDIAQAKVFWNIVETGGHLLPVDEAKLPFDSVWLEFSEPLGGLVAETDSGASFLNLSAIFLREYEGSIEATLIRSDNDLIGQFAFRKDEAHGLSEWAEDVLCNFSDYERLLPLVNACLSYINCENIYLEKQGEVPEAVNRKREKKGKSRLEPYYVCRIRGVQYDSDGTGEGSKHGIRYDVRGHFRRLTTGKTIWVRPHQRGLTNELYVPKVYHMAAGAKG